MFFPGNKRHVIARFAAMICLSALIGVSAVAKERPTKEKPRVADTAAAARLIIDGTNAFRRQLGRAPVKREAKLTDTALDFAKFLSTSDEFSHTADGRQPHERAKRRGYEYCVVLENIAYRFSSSGFKVDDLARGFVKGWEDSPGHRKNMLSPDVTEIGVAVVHNKRNGHYYAVQMFGRPRADMIEFDVENRAGVEVHYTLGERSYSLDAHEGRAHRLCGSPTLELQGSNDKGFAPQHHGHYVVTRDAGKLRLQRK